MSKFAEGTVVIVNSGQAGTVIDDRTDTNIGVLLANGNLWYGPCYQCREPQSQEDLDSCPLEVDRFEVREKSPRKLRERDDD